MIARGLRPAHGTARDRLVRPYKKMDATSSIVSVERPAYWDEVAAYAAQRGLNP